MSRPQDFLPNLKRLPVEPLRLCVLTEGTVNRRQITKRISKAHICGAELLSLLEGKQKQLFGLGVMALLIGLSPGVEICSQTIRFLRGQLGSYLNN